MKTYHCPLLPGKVYHLYNHAVGNENLFREDGNFVYFLDKYRKYILPVCRTFSYALLPNHFHFSIQVRSISELAPLMLKYTTPPDDNDCAEFVMQQFSNLCNAYAKAYNKLYCRRGALFIDFIRRKPVENAEYFRQLIVYHHFNAIHHGFCDTPLDYRFTSYPAYLNEQPSLLERETVLARFGGREAFIARHAGYDWGFDDELEL